MFQILTDLFGDNLKMYTNLIATSVVGLIGVVGFAYIFKMRKSITLAYFKGRLVIYLKFPWGKLLNIYNNIDNEIKENYWYIVKI